jgi:hypothetical protein
LSVLVLQVSIAHAAPPRAPAAAPPKALPATSAVPSASAPPTERDAMKSAARDLFDKGSKAMDESRWEDCRAALLAAWSIHPSHQIAGNLAECEVKLERHADAAEHLRFFLREIPATAPPERKARGEELLREVRPKIAELTLRVSKPDAEIFVDGKSVGRSPLATSVYVEPGDHAIEARLAGAVAKGAVSAKGGGAHEVTLAFADEDAPATARKEIVIAGASLGSVAVITGGVLLGVAIAQREALVPDAPKNGLGTAACADVQPAAGASANCNDLRSKAAAAGTTGQAGVGLLIGGAAVGAATALYALWPRSAGRDHTSRVIPAIGPNGAGFVWMGSF